MIEQSRTIIFILLCIFTGIGGFIVFQDIKDKKVNLYLIILHLVTLSGMLYLLQYNLWFISIVLAVTLFILSKYNRESITVKNGVINVSDVIYTIATIQLIFFTKGVLSIWEQIVPLALLIIITVLIEKKNKDIAFLAFGSCLLSIYLILYVSHL